MSEELKYPLMCLPKEEIPYVIDHRVDMFEQLNKICDTIKTVTHMADIYLEVMITVLDINKSFIRKYPRKKKKKAMKLINDIQNTLCNVQGITRKVHNQFI